MLLVGTAASAGRARRAAVVACAIAWWQQSAAVMTLAPMSHAECLSVDASAAACLRRCDGAASVRELRSWILTKRSTWTRLLSDLARRVNRMTTFAR
jgi:hypothetical protein